MVERIRALLALRQLTPTQFADLIRVGRPIVSHILSGRNKASLEVVQRIVAAFPEVALPWLLNGSGPMLAAPDTTPSADVRGVGTGYATDVPVAIVPTPPGPAKREVESSPQGTSRLPAAKSLAPKPVVVENDKTTRLNVSAPRPAAQALNSFSTKPNGQQQPQRFSIGVTNRQFGSHQGQTSRQNLLEEPERPEVTAAINNAAATAVQQGSIAVPGVLEGAPTAATAAATATTPNVAGAQEQAKSASLPLVIPDSTPDSSAVRSAASEVFPNKAIRRIVLFYHDGSFSDFRPEA